MVGIGNDLHRLAEGRPLIIGGVEIDSPIGCVAHSDGDVLIHSLIDALLGAMALGDIGEWFPDSDAKYKNVNSADLLKVVLDEMHNRNYQIHNIDSVVMLQKPKLSPYKQEIKENIANLCGISADRVNVKAKTGEKIGIVGNSEGIEALCIVEINKREA